jgi:tripartite-type tricarboxylate transporter receptor subunit TctC
MVGVAKAYGNNSGRNMRVTRILCLLMVTLTFGPAAVAQSYPTKAVRIICPFPSGGASDVTIRIVAERLTAAMGEPFVIDNRSGAGGNLGSEIAAKSAPDGYTLLLGTSGTHAINKTLYRTLPFDPEADFAPISLYTIIPNILVVNKNLPVSNVKEFIAHAKANPGKVHYGSIGNGSSQHLAGAQFEMVTGVQLVHIPYRGAPQGVADLLSGQIEAMFQLLPNIAEQVRAGEVKALAVTSSKRSTALPNVPTMAEAGVANYETAGWFGLLAPAKTPPAIVEKLNQEIVKVMKLPDLRARFAELGAEPVSTTPAEFAKFIHDELKNWATIVKASGAQLD